jgi:hypothetical protein
MLGLDKVRNKGENLVDFPNPLSIKAKPRELGKGGWNDFGGLFSTIKKKFRIKTYWNRWHRELLGLYLSGRGLALPIGSLGLIRRVGRC